MIRKSIKLKIILLTQYSTYMSTSTFSTINQPARINIKNELLAGLTVAMTMIPESLSFAILAGLSPLTGLYAAFIMGIVTAIFGGRPGMVSGGAGATIIVLIALIKSHGTDYLFAAVALAGIFQILVGVFKLGKFIKLIPLPVMYGFVNGLAVVIFTSQLTQFKITNNGVSEWMTGTNLYMMLGLVALTILVVVIFPKITKAIPASLMGIIVVFAVVMIFNIDTKTVKDIANISGSLPKFRIPSVPFNFETLKVIAPYSIVMAGVGLLETLLTFTLVDEITSTKGNNNKECVAQGSANILNGFFGGMGGCAMIAQTFVNLEAGSRARLSGIISSLTILLIILVGAPVIEKIPMAALVGVMMIVAITTFKWSSFSIIKKMPKADIFVGILVAIITIVFHNLALAVLVGVVIAALVFTWKRANVATIQSTINADGSKTYRIEGPLFFGATMDFNDHFKVLNDPEIIFIDFENSSIEDMSGIESIRQLFTKYRDLDKKVQLINVDKNSQKILSNAQLSLANFT